MIEIKLFITDSTNSPAGTLRNHPTAEVEPPYELLGEFLTVELDRPQAWLYQNLPQIRQQILLGQLQEYDGGGEGHFLILNHSECIIETMYADPNRQCTLKADEFWNAFDRWIEFVTAYLKTRNGS